MWDIISPYLLFALGLLLLIKGGDWFVDSSVSIAHRFRIPELLIGATVVSVGTTIPEVMVSSISAAQGNSQIAYGNAIGSVICNTALIAAISVAVRPGAVDRKAIRIPVLFFFGAAVFYAAVAYFGGYFSRAVGIVLLLGFVTYMTVNILQAKKEMTLAKDKQLAEEEPAESGKLWKVILFLVLGAAAIAVGANLLVDNGTKIAESLGVPASVIGLTFVALGTSLPELVTAITSLAKGHSSLSIGNIIGANLFNLVFVSGLAITIRPFEIPAAKTIAGLNASLVVDIPVMFAVMGILTIPALLRGKLSRAQGILLLVIYTGFCAFQFFL